MSGGTLLVHRCGESLEDLAAVNRERNVLREDRNALLEALKAVQWGREGAISACAVCLGGPESGHFDDCIVGLALARPR